MQLKREDYRVGVLTVVMRQLVGDKNADVYDYFPQHKERGVKGKTPTAAEVRARMRAYAAQVGDK